MQLKPLSQCIKSFQHRLQKNFDGASTDKLFELIIECSSKLMDEREDGPRVDFLRAYIWFLNAALTRRRSSPRARACLGDITTKPTRLLHFVTRQDAPYLDLQWLGFHHPDHVPKKWRDIQLLSSITPGAEIIPEAVATNGVDHDIWRAEDSQEGMIDTAFEAADRLIQRAISVADKCREMKLSPALQSEMRWLCSRSTRKLLREIEEKEHELRKRMQCQGIKQLTKEMIDNRLQIIRAWKLSGGGVNWQATADTYTSLTGEVISRQAIRDMIKRLGEQKFIRRRRRRNKTLEPILSGE